MKCGKNRKQLFEQTDNNYSLFSLKQRVSKCYCMCSSTQIVPLTRITGILSLNDLATAQKFKASE